MRIVLITGGFDPLHAGHIEYIKAARKLGDRLIVGINSDAWLTRKKGQPFLPCWERVNLLDNIKHVDQVITFNDDDGSAIDAIHRVKAMYPQKHTIVFANGGDRTKDNIPEMIFEDVEFVFGIGGFEKINSSTNLLKNWSTPVIPRPWGQWRVFDNAYNYKIKELVVNPQSSLSFQRHQYRAEFWYILKGTCRIKTEYLNVESLVTKEPHSTYVIGKEVWHQIINETTEPCHILEVQYGEKCVEEDIERR